MRILAVARRLLRQFARDRRTLALLLAAPLLVLALLSLIFDTSAYHPRIAAVGLPAPLAAKLEQHGARVRVLSSAEADRALGADRVDAVIRLAGRRPQVVLEGSDPTASRAVAGVLQKVAHDLRPPPPELEPEILFLHGSADLSPFDNFGPVLLGFLVFFFTFLVSGISFVRERTTGTLERMLSTPLRRHEIVLGYALGFALIVVVQSTLIALVSVYLLDMLLAGSLAWLLVITLLLAATALTIGMFLSAFARNEFQMMQFIPLVIVPQIFFSGLFNMETMSPALRALGALLPLTYGAHAMREVMIRGGGFADIARDIAVLAGYAVVILAGNVLALRKYRRI